MRAARTDREIAQAITSATLTDGGATFVLPRSTGSVTRTSDAAQHPGFTGALSRGYPVYVVGGAAGITGVLVPLQQFGSDTVYRMLQRVKGERVDGVGTWVHDGTVYIDAVDFWTYAPTAFAVARERGETAVWDNGRGESVDVADWFSNRPGTAAAREYYVESDALWEDADDVRTVDPVTGMEL